VFTSNVDGHFQKAGFDIDRIVEVHGSIHYLQCLVDCGMGLFSADKAKVDVNPADMLAQRPLPACPACGSQARPNILMFDDMEWDSSRTVAQQARLKEWLEAIGGSRLVIVECGAGMTIPTVRWYCETTANARGATLIRINLREAAVPKNQIGIAAGAMETLLAIDRALTSA
jgi:NAD-dependent SIR2 family protein deacetylase